MYKCMFMYKCVYVCIYVLCIYVYVYMFMYICVYVGLCGNFYLGIHVYMNTELHLFYSIIILTPTPPPSSTYICLHFCLHFYE